MLRTHHYYFILKEEGKNKHNLTVNDMALGYTYPILKKGSDTIRKDIERCIVQIYLDDWYTKPLGKIILGYNYYTLSEIFRRTSHELTHLYAFLKDKRNIHILIDDAIKNGTEKDLPMKSLTFDKTNIKYFVYDIKGIAAIV